MNVADVEIVGDGLDSDQLVREHIRTQVFFDDRPAPGTRCAVCDLKGGKVPPHYCPAKAYLGEYPVCAECSRNEVCAHELAIDRMHAGASDYGEFEAAEGLGDPGHHVDLAEVVEQAAAPVESDWKIKSSLSVDNLRTVRRSTAPGRIPQRRERLQVVLPSDRPKTGKRPRLQKVELVVRGELNPVTEQQESEESAMGRGGVVTRISDDIRAKVRAEYGTMATLALARKYSISGGSVDYICRDMKAVKPGASKAMVKSAKPAAVAAPVKAVSGEPVVTLQVPESGLDRMFASLDLSNKARAIQYLISEGVGV